jgi:hypothetical protein
MQTRGARWARSSVLGIRPSASIRLRCRVPGTRDLRPGTRAESRYRRRRPGYGGIPGSCSEKRAHGVCNLQDGNGNHILHLAYPVCGFFEDRYRYLGPDTWYLMQINAADRTPSTEDRARPPENAHTGFAF